jgi:hypothetical protein
MAMSHDRFAAWRRAGIARGQRQLAQTIRLLVYKADPGLFELLDYEDDNCFLDPLLFAFFTNPAPTVMLPQLLAGRIPPQHRPAEVAARADARGQICLPGVGMLEIELPNAAVTVQFSKMSGELRCNDGSNTLPAILQTAGRVSGTTIEVEKHRQPLFDRFFLENGGAPDATDFAGAASGHLRHLTNACALLRDHCPDLAEELFFATRRIVLYRWERPYSFATLSAHGAIFLNVTGVNDEVYFVEDIAHQVAHVMFNALTLNKKRFLSIDPETPLGTLHGNEHEPRTVYAAYHGLFTYVMIGWTLATLLERGAFEGRQAHEAIGRLGLILRKFAYDLALLDKPQFFTALGRRCWRHFEDVYTDLQRRYGPLVGGFDYRNQPYVFDYRRFAQLNPSASGSAWGSDVSLRACLGAI